MRTANYDINSHRPDISLPQSPDQAFGELRAREQKGYSLEAVKKYIDLYYGDVPGDIEEKLEGIKHEETQQS